MATPVKSLTAAVFALALSVAVPGTARAQETPECPANLVCRFAAAAYERTSGGDANAYGNYDRANRPADGQQIQYIVIHDTEGVPGSGASPYDQAIATFREPSSGSSAHYVIRSSDGQVTQMVPTKDVAWHAGNWTMNEHSIGIEHEGIAAQGSTWYTEQMYQASANLVKYLAAKYHIPLDRQHILGHEDITRERTENFAAAHWDPGPYWDWPHYMDLLGAPIEAGGPADSPAVMINPGHAHGVNFVALHTASDAASPLITDPVVHPDGSAGTTAIDDWSDKAVAGRTYSLAGEQGDWTAIWYGGQKAWFANPGHSVTVPAKARRVTAATSVPLYGRAFPEQSEYPADIPFDPIWTVGAIPWTLPAGQSYVVTGEFRAENYYARFDPAGVPANHTLVTGATTYLQLSYNHRVVYVKAADVQPC
ncbi:N-acetylmuramoyl-L-alanine amidase [Amycolatopsis pretoriensis]|uniref:N-acetylmuramoyl-L-alanine amidase n=1 Tax=Amycolatopsis pretoriensis TaxID=218821 RepID=A0A1H5QRP2_9PSEU|nr:peptidoglycan recognition family protein [Amycolatopsis pretoriensis]SEF28780.1 N-acetylmuramoyl-L-alanine amidase [Amycolatopsis pretoriensis]